LLLLFFMTIFVFYDQRDNKIAKPGFNIGYNLSVPYKVYVLPKALQEISGIAETDTSAFACIQDEKEIVYIFDVNKGQIIKKLNLGYSGDYEGIARVDNTLYILRSDGVLSEITNFETDQLIRTTYSTGIPWKDNEGICSDPKNNRLLIAPKMNPEKNSGTKKKRFIYGFDLVSKKLIKEPVLILDLYEIERFARENNIKVPVKDKKKDGKKEPDIKFRMSAIEIHPITGRLFVLSSIDKLLFVFNMNSEIEYMERLNPKLFNQPEGITFMKNGDLFISNEGKKKSPTLVRFKYEPSAVKTSK
jgi:uncharacterized protein YjiK